jgi:uncharacterized protein YuzE
MQVIEHGIQAAYYGVCERGKGDVVCTIEIERDTVVVDVDDEGRVLGIEVLGDHDPVGVPWRVLAGLRLSLPD